MPQNPVRGEFRKIYEFRDIFFLLLFDGRVFKKYFDPTLVLIGSVIIEIQQEGNRYFLLISTIFLLFLEFHGLEDDRIEVLDWSTFFTEKNNTKYHGSSRITTITMVVFVEAVKIDTSRFLYMNAAFICST